MKLSWGLSKVKVHLLCAIAMDCAQWLAIIERHDDGGDEVMIDGQSKTINDAGPSAI